MNDFMNWLKKKYLIESYILEIIKAKTSYISEKILIGFMIEYCIEHRISFHILASSDIKQTYNYLKEKIENKITNSNIEQKAINKVV